MSTKPTVAIAYYSGYGHTDVLAQAVKDGATDAGAEVTLVRVDTITDEQWQVLDDADAIVFGSPTYMGSAAGKFHVFAESTSKRWAGAAWRDKLGAGFTNAACKAGDKHSTLAYFATLGAQHQMNWVNLGLHPGWHTSTESENDLNRLGYFNGAAASTPADLPPQDVSKADVATAEYLGARVAEQTAIVLAGRAAASTAATDTVVDAFFAAFGSGDVDATVALFADEVDFRVSGAPNVPWTGARSAKGELAEFFGTFGQVLTMPESFELTGRVTEGEHAVVTARCVFGVLATGRKFTNHYALHFTVSDGRVSRYHMYEDSHAIAEAFAA